MTSTTMLTSTTVTSSVGFNESNQTVYYDYHDDGQVVEFMFLMIFWQYVTPAIFVIIMIVGLFGNSCVVYVIVSKPSMRTPTNFMLLNLAISDILFLIVVVPFTAYKYSALFWPFGEIWCKAMKYCLYVSCYVTVYTLVAVAMQRFLIIVYSRGHDMWRRPKNVFLMIIFIWGAVLIGNIWKWNIHTVKTVERVGVTYCGVTELAISPLFLTYFVFGYLVPLILVSIFYFLIVMYLRRAPVVTTGNEWKSVDTAPGEQCNNNTTQALTNNNDTSNTGASRRQRKRKRVCRVLIVVILTFAICWLPLHVSLLCGQFWVMPKSTFYEVLRVLWHCMAYSNSCANPIIYNYASREFRKHFAAMFCRAKTQVRTSTSGATAAASTRVGSDGMPVPPFSEATELSRMKTAMETHL